MKFLLLLFLIGFATAKVIPYEWQEDEERSIADIWAKIKDFFSDLEIDLKKKYMLFGEWVTKTFKEGIEKGKSAVENVKKIAKEFIDKAEEISKDVAHEAEEFFDKHKDDLGDIWKQVQEALKKAGKRRGRKFKMHIRRRG